jgi:protein O-GlcNAc transferase
MESNDKRTAVAELRRGTDCLRSGDLDAARQHYQQALEADPDNAGIWFLLGAVALERGDATSAASCMSNCLARQPLHAEAANSLGIALRKLDRPTEAISAFRRAMASKERYFAAAFNLGIALEAVGDDAEAEATYRRVLSWGGHAGSATCLANLLRRKGRTSDAFPLFELAQRLAPQNSGTCCNLAFALLESQRADEARACARIATSVDPDNPVGWRALGLAENLLDHNQVALAALRKAAKLAPGDATIAAELGTILIGEGYIDEARMLAGLAATAKFEGERMRWQIALSLPSVYASEAQVDAERQRFARGLDEISDGLRLESPEQRRDAYRAACSASTFLLHYQARDNTKLQSRFGDLVDRVMAAVAPQLMQPIARRSRTDGRRVRVGFVGSHLMHHTVSRYFRRMITGLDPARFEISVWYGGKTDDFSTQEITGHVSRFEPYPGDPLTTAERIRREGLDVLIYPEIGMDPRHQVLGAMRLAPVQCVLYGHPVSTGLPNMDYFLSGAGLEPENAQAHYREKLVLLPGLGAAPVRPPAPGAGTTPSTVEAARPLLLCLQNPLKLPPSFDRTLAAIAAGTGGCIGFFIRNVGIGQRFRQRIEAAFQQYGLDPSRALVFMPKTKHEGFLQTVWRADLILDTPGFSGGATSLDALSVGAPVLAWETDMARGRQTAAMLRLIDAADLIVGNEGDYIATAVALCRDAERRSELRARIGANVGRLFDDNAPIEALAAFLASVA